ncbi:hypothetical protein LPJ59_002208 [Coemansia sp. RSA 2399]|nr:hypothetical protein LPJ59_002208 [Coemansia sp. RSA 2399]KAJ1905798.1 hypothetical protein LPJ81_001722 [Coemansia sp. IMI 209127]
MAWSRAISHDEAIRLIRAYDVDVANVLAERKKNNTTPDVREDVDEDSTYVRLLLPPSWDSSRMPMARGHMRPELNKGQDTPLGRHMPSSVMHRLDMEFHEDVKRRRRQQGLRIRILAALGVLRQLIRTSGDLRDTSGRVYIYLEELNQLYIDCFRCGSPHPLVLRSGNCVTLDMGGAVATNPSFVVVTHDRTGPQLAKVSTYYCDDDSASAMFNRETYTKKKRRREEGEATTIAAADIVDAIDPRLPCWIDYLVDDLSEADAHALFRLVSRSKVPHGSAALYRAAIEEALVFAFNRKGHAVDPLEGLRACTYFIRHIDIVSQKNQLRAFWKHAGRWCFDNLVHRAVSAGDATTIDELRFKRWNNVASELIEVYSKAGDLQAAWNVVAEWHGVWTRVMQTMCPVRRRGFVEGNDPYVYPYWRPKAPGRFRLHELTLSSHAITCMMTELSKARLMDSAAELLGLATSEAGVSIVPSMFTIMLRGVAEVAAAAAAADGGLTLGDMRSQKQPSLVQPSLEWTNTYAPSLYKGTGLAGKQHANNDGRKQSPVGYGGARAQLLVMALLRGLSRWAITPDAFTLEALVQYACAVPNTLLLRTIVQLFASAWGIEPTERSWIELEALGLNVSVRVWIDSANHGADADA